MDNFEAVIETMVNEGWLEATTGDAADELGRRVHELAPLPGGAWAIAKAASIAHEGWRREWVRALKREKRQYVISYNGTALDPISVTDSIAVAQRDAGGRKTGAYQPVLFHYGTWEQFREAREEKAKQHARLGSVIAVYDNILALQAKYPTSRGPREALLAEGIDPDSMVVNL